MQACILYLEDWDTHLILSQKDASKRTNNLTAIFQDDCQVFTLGIQDDPTLKCTNVKKYKQKCIHAMWI